MHFTLNGSKRTVRNRQVFIKIDWKANMAFCKKRENMIVIRVLSDNEVETALSVC